MQQIWKETKQGAWWEPLHIKSALGHLLNDQRWFDKKAMARSTLRCIAKECKEQFDNASSIPALTRLQHFMFSLLPNHSWKLLQTAPGKGYENSGEKIVAIFIRPIPKAESKASRDDETPVRGPDYNDYLPQKRSHPGHQPIKLMQVPRTYIIGGSGGIEKRAFGRDKAIWRGVCSCFANGSSLGGDWTTGSRVWKHQRSHSNMRKLTCSVKLQTEHLEVVLFVTHDDAIRRRGV